MADKEIKYVNQAIKDEHDNSSSPFTKRTILYGWDADNLQKVRVSTDPKGKLGENLAIQIDTDSVDSNVTYIGMASIGTSTSNDSWQIQKIDETSGTVITWADGDDNYNNIFDNRESLSYS